MRRKWQSVEHSGGAAPLSSGELQAPLLLLELTLLKLDVACVDRARKVQVFAVLDVGLVVAIAPGKRRALLFGMLPYTVPAADEVEREDHAADEQG
jgi:hypothetical protein